MAKNSRRSEDQGTQMPSLSGELLANGYPTEELCADPNIARGWADYTSLNPMDEDVLNQGSSQKKPGPTPKNGEEEMSPR